MYDIIVGPLFILLLFESAHVTQRVKMIKSFFRNSEAVSTTIHTHKPLKAFNIFSDQRAVILIDLFCSIGLPLLLHLYLRIQQLSYLHPPPPPPVSTALFLVCAMGRFNCLLYRYTRLLCNDDFLSAVLDSPANSLGAFSLLYYVYCIHLLV